MKRTIIILVVIVLLVVLGILGYNLLNKNKANDNMDIVRLNEVTRSVFYSPQYVAISEGFFKNENIEIEIVTGQGADKVMTAVLANQSDIRICRTRSGNICV